MESTQYTDNYDFGIPEPADDAEEQDNDHSSFVANSVTEETQYLDDLNEDILNAALDGTEHDFKADMFSDYDPNAESQNLDTSKLSEFVQDSVLESDYGIEDEVECDFSGGILNLWF